MNDMEAAMDRAHAATFPDWPSYMGRAENFTVGFEAGWTGHAAQHPGAFTREELETLRAYVLGDHFNPNLIDTAVDKINAVIGEP